MVLKRYQLFLLLFLLLTACGRQRLPDPAVVEPEVIALEPRWIPRHTGQETESAMATVIRVTNTPPAEITATVTPTPISGDTGTASAGGARRDPCWHTVEVNVDHGVELWSDPPCIHWNDEYQDEPGFRLVLERGAKRYVWEAPAGTQHFLMPEEALPPLSQQPECLAPYGYNLEVFVIRPDGETLVGSEVVDGEDGACP